MPKDKKNDFSDIRKKKGSYSISVVAEMFGVHQQTIRLYEKEGLITPSRSAGNTRKFTEEDVAQLEEVIYLTHKLGVNLAGVSLILKFKDRIKKMQGEMNSLFDQVKQNLEKESADLKFDTQEQISKLLEIKKSKKVSNESDLSRHMQEIHRMANEDIDFAHDDEEEEKKL